MQIAVLNKSEKLAGRTKDVVAMVTACARQLRRHAAPAWNRVPASVVYCADEASVPPGAHQIVLFDKADQADALGYHDETPEGVVYGRVFIDPIMGSGGGVLSGPDGNAVSTTLSHEVLELFGDPHCNLWADGPDGEEYCVELGDPVECDAYPILVGTTQVSVSNFVFPEWFDPNPPEGSKLDYLGRLSAPFTMTAGGYVIYRKAGKVLQRFGQKFPEWKLPGKARMAARSVRRTARSSNT